MKLTEIGWNPEFDAHFAEYGNDGFAAVRISHELKNHYGVLTEYGEMTGVLTGKLMYDSVSRLDLPVVGDWAAASIFNESPPKAVIHTLLPRKSLFVRKEAGKRTEPQPVAANVDTVFITIGLDHNFNLRRIERYLALAWESGSTPVVLLTKSDICDDKDRMINEVQLSAVGVDVLAISTFNEDGLNSLEKYLVKGRTLALIGSSGVGKSTLINYLHGFEKQDVQEVRQDDSRGRHTTSSRQLFVLDSGAMIIDTPGMRELQLWDVDEGLNETFKEIEKFALECKFVDCTHENEPGCRILSALETGELDLHRFENYKKMQKEMHHFALRQDKSLTLIEREKWKSIRKQIKKFYKK